MNIDELWLKMQKEFNKQNENIKVGNIESKVTAIEDKVTNVEDKVTVLEDKVTNVEDKVTVLEEKVTNVEDKVTVIEDKVTNVEDKVGNIESKVNTIDNKVYVISNSNIAQILYELTRINTEMNEKLNNFMEVNQVEHKKFEYEISKLGLEIKYPSE